MRSTVLALLMLLISGISLSAQQQGETAARMRDLAWQKVGRIKQQQEIKVYLQDGKKLKGRLSQVDENGLLLRIKSNKSMHISKEDIQRITYNSGARGALIGLGAGVGIGALVYSVVPIEDLARSESAMLGAGVGAMVGSLAGGLIGKDRTVFQTGR